MEMKKCKLCGELFEPSGRNASRQKYCNRQHYGTCEVCGKSFVITKAHIASGTIPKCCSRKCSNKLKMFKAKKTIKQQYGVDNISQSKVFKDKIRQGIVNKQTSIQEHRKETMLERYGVAYPIQDTSIATKIKTTNLERYGVDNPSKSDKVKQKISTTLKSDTCKQQRLDTNLARYGVPHPSQNDAIKTKTKGTNVSRYGTSWPTQNDTVKKKIAHSQEVARLHDPTIVERSTQSIHTTCKNTYGIDWPCQLPQCVQASNKQSNVNTAFANKLKENGIVFTTEYPIGKYSYDICIPSIHTVVELNPTYTHNVIGNHWNPNGIPENYHINKTAVASQHGYRCIHSWDWDSWDDIIQLLTPKQSIYARRCKVKLVDIKTAKLFLHKYHLQKSVRGQKVCIGLYYETELVELMTFGKPRYNKMYEWELLRLCTHTQYTVVGGASKLFKYFINTYNPSSIISYCDKSKFTGNVYEAIGMTLHHITPPAKIWSKGHQKITDNLLRQRGYDQLFHTHFGRGTSNEKLMLESNWLPVYDCGQAVYEYRYKYCKGELI